MKDSEIEWIGEIPDDWGIIKAKYILVANDGGVWGDDPTGTDNDKIVLRSTEQTVDGLWCINKPARRNLSKVSYAKYLIYPNDLLMTKSSGSCAHIGKTTLAGTYFLTHECYYSNFLQRLRVTDTFLPKYIWYILNSIFTREQFVFLQNSTSGIGNINSENINDIILPLLSIVKQQRIADYLDKKCSAVDRLIENQRQQIETLKEYKQSVITEAVTKGLDPSAPLKDSGVEWIGNICKWFDLRRLKEVAQILDECRKPITADLRNQEADVLYDYYGASGVIDKIDGYTIDDHVMLIGEDGANLRMRNLPLMYEVNGKAWINNHAHILKPNSDMNFYYLFYCLESFDINPYITGSAQPKLSQENLKNILLPVPPLAVQKEIADYLDKKCTEIDKLISIKQQKIETLTEYKKSLIYEYVTGKKQVG